VKAEGEVGPARALQLSVVGYFAAPATWSATISASA
jgi:hypothetical protein